MPRDVKIRAFRSTTANAKPPTSGADGITAGELAANLADKLLFLGASNGGYITYRDQTQSVWSVNGNTGDYSVPLATVKGGPHAGVTGFVMFNCEDFVIDEDGTVSLGFTEPCYLCGPPFCDYPKGSGAYWGGIGATFDEGGKLLAFVFNVNGLTEAGESTRTQYIPILQSGTTKKITAEKFISDNAAIFTAKTNTGQLSITKDTGTNSVDFAIVMGAVSAADQGLVKGASAFQYITQNTVKSINGLTGDVGCIAVTCAAQSFSGLQTFVNGISGPSGFFSGTDNVLEIVASTNGRGIRISKSNDPNSSDSGIGYIQFGKYTTENRNWHLGSIGDRNFVFAQGNLGGTPTELLKWVFSGGYAGSGAWLIGSPAGTPYYLPDSDGTLGQIVYTDGSGNLYFDDPPAGGGGGSLTGFVLRSGDGLTSPIEANNTLTITGGVGIFTAKDGNDTVSVRGITATTSVLGVASFAANDFLVSSGAVSLTAGVVRSVNGLTGAVSLPLATTGASGVASFNSAHFTVSTTGHVSLASAPAGAGGTKTYEVFTALDNHPPVTDFAVFDTRGLTNTLGVLEFDGLVRKYATFVGKIPESASFNNLKVALDWCFAGTATEPEPSSIVWGVRWERLTTTSLDAESFSTGVTSGRVDTIGVVGGIPQSTTITCPYSSVDGLTAGLPFKLQVYRDAASLDDEAGPNLELFCVEVRGD